jgi:hypothetical protein
MMPKYETKSGMIQVEGVGINNYAASKAREAYANYLKNPTSLEGQSSFMRYVKYKHPVLSHKLAGGEGMNPGASHIFATDIEGQPVKVVIKHIDGALGTHSLQLIMQDETGEEATNEITYDNYAEVASALIKIKTGNLPQSAPLSEEEQEELNDLESYFDSEYEIK